MLVVDDSHGHGVMGQTGRGTHEHCGLRSDQVDILTGTLGKALGGGAGGFVAGSQTAIDLLVQRARPTLFSNALPTTVAASAEMAIKILQEEPERVERLRANVERARSGIRDAGFEVLESPTAICPIIVGDTARAIRLSERLLEKGVFVIGFGYPVVPEGEARLRVQISAAHTDEHIDRLVEAASGTQSRRRRLSVTLGGHPARDHSIDGLSIEGFAPVLMALQARSHDAGLCSGIKTGCKVGGGDSRTHPRGTT